MKNILKCLTSIACVYKGCSEINARSYFDKKRRFLIKNYNFFLFVKYTL